MINISAPEGTNTNDFGRAVSISGDTILISSEGTSLNGAVNIFEKEKGFWHYKVKLTPSDADSCCKQFGKSVSVSGDYAVIGAVGDSENGASAGAAYVFRRSNGIWQEQAKLLSDDGFSADDFGNSVSISVDYAIIGAYRATGSVNDSGAAYIFKREGTNWVQQAKLFDPLGKANDDFGFSVAISGDRAVVGAPNVYTIVQGIPYIGAAFVYKRTGDTWVLEEKLISPISYYKGWGEFGESVSIHRDMVVVGAPNSTGLETGSVVVYKYNGNTWTPHDNHLYPNNASSYARFGCSVATYNNKMVVGAEKILPLALFM